ncbi:hypothetical protein AGDE_04121 [Angomonas deanei]|uniref:Uncharacterized protein n=1 Tax=Angomonas deanei TaxID=59799 RepID=S9VAX1_9TRYP|nr:hypothetical protein AGDE_05832 [Angomonas deanei]EPY39807.1 hypothetical protein AGDE_04121 [Angomonas deanei]CAD2220505.1 hypothetical protein, conserved [Angomonas deanei]|eukprot:EPY38099.1 hypothetical protein AGDE_05832 [Angomonas deanei]
MAEAREAYHEQMSREREYERLMKETQSGKMDRRFFSKFSDYRQIQDNDPYSSVFGESKTTQRVRTAAWQRQFEEENKDTFLPYERDSTLKRLAPNWFVRYFVKMRDNGGADSAMMLYVMFAFTVSTLCLIAYMFYTAPSRARPVEEVR